jgi:hypothetical protein
MTENTGHEPFDLDQLWHGETVYTSPYALMRDQDNRGWLWLWRRTSPESSGDLTLAMRIGPNLRVCWFTEREHFIMGLPRQSLDHLIEEGRFDPAILLERPWDEYEPAALRERIHELINQRNVYWPQVTTNDIDDAPPTCGKCGAALIFDFCDMCDGDGEVTDCESEGGDSDNVWLCSRCDGIGLMWWCPDNHWRGAHRQRSSDKAVE